MLTRLSVLLGFANADRHLFTAFGDWGENSGTMRSTVAQLQQQSRPDFVVLLGDSFYPKGVQSVDDPQFRLFDSFSDVCESFFVALGNHDYGYANSVQSLIKRSEMDPKWILPSPYYLKRLDLGNGYELCAIVLDTHIFESSQLSWLETQLRGCQGERVFRYILTHYPLLTVGVYANSGSVTRLRSRILPLIERYSVHAYISGHEHQSQVFEKNGAHFIVAGATAQMNRNKGGDKSKWRNELKFFNDKDAAILSFYIVDGAPGLMRYKLVKSSDGTIMYSSVINVNKPTSTTTEAFVSYLKEERQSELPTVKSQSVIPTVKSRATAPPKSTGSPGDRQPEDLALVTDSNASLVLVVPGPFVGFIWIFLLVISV